MKPKLSIKWKSDNKHLSIENKGEYKLVVYHEDGDEHCKFSSFDDLEAYVEELGLEDSDVSLDIPTYERITGDMVFHSLTSKKIVKFSELLRKD